ncbi:MAG: FGGY-family carbohydrate kinase [Actinomycetota bacterium]
MSTARSDGPFLLGIDMGTESCRVGVFDTSGTPLVFEATPYQTAFPKPGMAEQKPSDWWASLVKSVHGAVEKSGVSPESIAGISFDGTTYTLVAADADGKALRPAIMWMDVRASDQAARIGESDHPVRAVNGGGPVSAEWFAPKALWLKENEPEVFTKAHRLIDSADWIGFNLTGRWTANINTAAVRSFYNRDLGGWPTDFYEEIGLGDALAKMPQDVPDLGTNLGGLTAAAASALGLKEGTPVAQGPGDAWAAQIGLNVVKPGKMALITGSSHVLIGQHDKPVSGTGFWGAYPHAVVPGQYTVEGGQVSTGSVLKWFVDNFQAEVGTEADANGKKAYDILNERAAEIPPGSEGLIVNEYWQGNRTPYTDSLARGMMWGFSLRHTPAHVYRAIQEGVCYGTAHILRAMAAAGTEVNEFVAAGGATQSRFWMQMHADVTGVPVTLTKVGDAPVLGCAILASVAAGIHDDVTEAAGAMVTETDTLEPDPATHEEYAFFVDQYVDAYPQMRELIHNVVRHVGDA